MRQAGKTVCVDKQFANIGVDLEKSKLLSACYDALKQDVFFNGSEDDL